MAEMHSDCEPIARRDVVDLGIDEKRAGTGLKYRALHLMIND
jgi:hypothetical protein